MPTKKTTKKLKTNNVTGHKKILLLSVVAVMLIGVIAIVRSFAYTTQDSVLFLPAELVRTTPVNPPENILTTDTGNTNKKGTQVVQGFTSLDSSRMPASQTKLVNFVNKYPLKTARVCAYMRATREDQKNTSIEVTNLTLGGDGRANSGQKILSTTAYQDICTPNFVIKSNSNRNAYITVYNNSAFIGNVKVEIFDVTQPVAPAPASF